MYVYVHTHTHTHTHIFMCVYILYILKRCFPKNFKLF